MDNNIVLEEDEDDEFFPEEELEEGLPEEEEDIELDEFLKGLVKKLFDK